MSALHVRRLILVVELKRHLAFQVVSNLTHPSDYKTMPNKEIRDPAKKKMINVYKPLLTSDEKDALIDAYDSGWISGAGPEIKRCEETMKTMFGTEVALVSNGTTALHLALMAAGIGPGDKVLVPSFSYIATANAVRHCQAEPIFVDCAPDSWQADVEHFDKKFQADIKAIIVVYNYGAVGNVEGVIEWAKGKGLIVIEDCAEAMGSCHRGAHVGTLGDVGTFSFYGNKTVTCGEGGAVISKQREIIDRVKKLKGQGLAEYRQYWHDIIGFNYRLNNLSASLLISQLRRLDKIVEQKKNIFNKYFNSLSKICEFQKFSKEDCPWMTSILLPENVDRSTFQEKLMKRGIETRPLFYPIHTMPPYFSKYSPLQNCEYISRRGINLPSGPGTSDDEIGYVIDCVRKDLGATA